MTSGSPHRLVPNLREIILFSPRVGSGYEAAGLAPYFEGRSAGWITEERLVAELEAGQARLNWLP